MGINGIKPKRILFTVLTLELKKSNPKRYEFVKIKNWQHILQQGMIPVKWLKPNKYGTAIHFRLFDDMTDFEEATAELKTYVDEFNKTYNKTGSVDD